MARLAFALPVVVALAAPAAAQDRDPFQAVLDAQAVRERQAVQVHRAEARAISPFSGGAIAPVHQAPRGTPIEAPRNREPGEGSMPWVIPAVAVAAGIGVWLVRRSRRNRWSELPGHGGLRRS